MTKWVELTFYEFVAFLQNAWHARQKIIVECTHCGKVQHIIVNAHAKRTQVNPYPPPPEVENSW